MMSSRPSWPWVVCVVLLLAALLNYMDRQVLAVTLPTLKKQYHLAEGRTGVLEGSFGFAFATGSLFFGWLADRFGPKFLYPALLAGWSLAGVATSLAGQPWVTTAFQTNTDPEGTGIFRWLVACRVVLGFFEAGHWPSALLTIRAILSARDRTMGNGILQSGASMGAILVPIYVEATDRAGRSWEFPFWTVGLAGLIWIPFWFVVVGAHRLAQPAEPSVAGADRTTSFRSLFRRLVVLAIVVATLTISWQFLRAWLALFLQDHLTYTKEATRGLMSGYFIAADIGCLLSGALVAALVRRGWQTHPARVLGFFLFSMLTASGALVPFAGDGSLMIALIFVAGAGILGLHPYYYALTQELPAARMGMFSGALAAFGWIVSSLSQIYLGKHIEATQSYQTGLLLVGLAPMFGLLALVLLWPSSHSQPRIPQPT